MRVLEDVQIAQKSNGGLDDLRAILLQGAAGGVAGNRW